MVKERASGGWSVSILAFMFRHFSGSLPIVLKRRLGGIDHFYSKLVTRAVRDPRRAVEEGCAPFLLAAPDLPVAKGRKQPVKDVSVNGGLHCHAMVLIPPKARLRDELAAHLAGNEGLYIGEAIQRIHAETIAGDPTDATRYVLKAIENQRLGYDGILVHPRSLTELTTRPLVGVPGSRDCAGRSRFEGCT